MLQYEIRPVKSEEIPLLQDFLYEAIFQRDEQNLLPRSVIEEPELKVFIEGYGKKDDNCLVAVVAGKVVGAVWTRILSGPVKGYGHVDDQTPEFAISLYKEYRGHGIGHQLMLRMLQLLKAKGYAQASLAVQKDNYALKMYERVGFTIVDENEQEYIMVHKLENV